MDYKNYSPDELAKLQELYSRKEYLTVEEAAIWLSLSPGSVRSYLKNKKIVGVKFDGSKAWRIDVQRTRALISKSLNVPKSIKGESYAKMQ